MMFVLIGALKVNNEIAGLSYTHLHMYVGVFMLIVRFNMVIANYIELAVKNMQYNVNIFCLMVT